MKKQPEIWLAYADDDLRFARSGLSDGFFSHVCSLSQQAVEKALKGYLLAMGKMYPKTHNLPRLAKLIDESWLDEFEKTIKKMDKFYIPLRYPDAMAGTLPEGAPGKEDAEQALSWADELVGVVRKRMT